VPVVYCHHNQIQTMMLTSLLLPMIGLIRFLGIRRGTSLILLYQMGRQWMAGSMLKMCVRS
jgi:hypothetical protein